MSVEVSVNDNFSNFCDELSEESEYYCDNSEDLKFNITIGTIEDLIINEEFVQMQHDFLDKYWQKFEESEENKLIYMDIFQEYQEKIENYIENYLLENVQDFNMNSFIGELITRKNDLDGEIFEMLFTFTDFLIFKDMFLDYKAMKEGKTADLTKHISVSKLCAENEDEETIP